jgi:hypothetical protein
VSEISRLNRAASAGVSQLNETYRILYLPVHVLSQSA